MLSYIITGSKKTLIFWVIILHHPFYVYLLYKILIVSCIFEVDSLAEVFEKLESPEKKKKLSS